MKLVTKLLVSLTFIGTLLLGSVAAYAGPVTLKMVGSHGRSAAWVWPEYEKLAANVEKVTEGRVKLQIYDPGQLVPFVQHLEAVRAGIMDLADTVPGYYQNEFALSNLWNYRFTSFGQDATRTTRMWQDLYDQYMAMDFEKLGLECPGANGFTAVAYDVFTVDKPLKTMDDMKGLKLRSNSAAMNKIIEAGGGIPVFMGGGAAPDALSKGMLNGIPMSDHWGLGVKIWEYGKPGYWTVTGSFPQGVVCNAASTRKNSKWMKKVSPEDRAAIGEELAKWKYEISMRVNESAAVFQKTATENGVTLSEWPDSEKKRLQEGWADVINEAIEFAKKEGAPAKWMLDAMDQWLKDNPE